VLSGGSYWDCEDSVDVVIMVCCLFAARVLPAPIWELVAGRGVNVMVFEAVSSGESENVTFLAF
jgi:hypothetical protein